MHWVSFLWVAFAGVYIALTRASLDAPESSLRGVQGLGALLAVAATLASMFLTNGHGCAMHKISVFWFVLGCSYIILARVLIYANRRTATWAAAAGALLAVAAVLVSVIGPTPIWLSPR